MDDQIQTLMYFIASLSLPLILSLICGDTERRLCSFVQKKINERFDQVWLTTKKNNKKKNSGPKRQTRGPPSVVNWVETEWDDS